MIDDTGFKQVRVKVVIPGLPESAAILERLFDSADVSATLREAGVLDGRLFFEVDLFGITSKVEETLSEVNHALGADRSDLADPHPERPRPEEAHV